MTDSTSRHAEFELATNTALGDFSNVEAKREEQRNYLKHLVGRIDVFAIWPTGFGRSLIFQLFPRINRALEWRQDRMPFMIVVVTPLIAIMKDQVEHLNKIGVAAAMMGEDVDEAVKSGSCEIVWSLKIHSKAYCSHKSWLSKEWTKGLQKESLESKLQLSLLTRSTQSPNSKFSLRLLGIFIARVNDLYWNGFLSKWAIFVCHLIHNFFVTYTLKSCFKAVNKLLLPLSIVWKSYIRFLVRLCIHNINFWSEKFWFIRKKNNKCMGL